MMRFILFILCGLTGVEPAKLNFRTPAPAVIKSPGYSHDKPDLVVRTVINQGGFALPGGPIMSEGIKLAGEAIDRHKILPNYNLVWEMFDDECNQPRGVGHVVGSLRKSKGLNNTVPIFSGPLCSESEYTGHVIRHFGHVAVSLWTTSLANYYDRKTYDSFFALMPTMSLFVKAIPPFLRKMGWKTLFIITETAKFLRDWDTLILEEMEHLNISIAGKFQIYFDSTQPPELHLLEMAAREVVASNARIIYITSILATSVACWLHRVGAYGPDYVYILGPWSTALPNSFTFFPLWCTPKMLFEVQQSFFYYNYDFNMERNPHRPDSFGMTGHAFENELKARVLDPELHGESWYLFRGGTYDMALAIAVGMETIEKHLQKSNDTWLNWVTSSDNFDKNASYIHELMMETFADLELEGMQMSTSNSKINGQTGQTGFYQTKLVEGDFDSYARRLRIAHIGVVLDGVVSPGAEEIEWKTRDGLPPFDSLQLFDLEVPLIVRQSRWIIFAFVFLFFVPNAVFLAINIWKCFKGTGSWITNNSLAAFTCLINVGHMLMLMFVLSLCLPEVNVGVASCSSGFLLAVVGYSLLGGSVLGKMELAATLVTESNVGSQNPTTSRRRAIWSARSKGSRSMTTNQSMTARTNFNFSNVVSKNRANIMMLLVIGFALLNFLLAAIWLLGVEPMEMVRYDREKIHPTDEPSIVYHTYAMGCQLRNAGKTNVAYGMLAVLAAGTAVALFRAVWLAFSIPKWAKFKHISDYTYVKVSSYSLFLLSLVGGLLIWAMFATGDPERLVLAVSGLTFVVVAMMSGVIFVPKKNDAGVGTSN